MRNLDLPRGDERELVVDRERVYELDGQDSRTLAVVGAFRVVPEHDLDLPHNTLDNLHDQRLVDLVDLGDSERGLCSRRRVGRTFATRWDTRAFRSPRTHTGTWCQVEIVLGLIG